MSGWGIFFIVLFVVALLAGGGYIGYAHYRARRLGLPPPNLNPFSKKRRDDSTYRAPAPAPTGPIGWVAEKWNAFRNNDRTAGGAYQSTGYAAGASSRSRGRGFGPLDPDEAWDARVDHETSGYYEEQELGLQDPPSHGPYGGGGYGDNNISVGGIEAGRGRSKSRQRELDTRYDEEVHGGSSHLNPFGDGAESSNMSMRSVSPRPHEDTSYGGSKAHRKQNSKGSSESQIERRSMFKENM